MDDCGLYVVTGGPGSGKTTLLDALAAAGHATMPEAGRAVIRDQVGIGGPALPWADRALFAELMLDRELCTHRAASELPGPVFLDRGVPDVVGYLRLEDLPVPAHADVAARRFRYAPTVFVAPPWPAIYTTDTERRQSPEVARRTYEAMLTTYPEYGYRTVELPRAPVAERVAFVLARTGRRSTDPPQDP